MSGQAILLIIIAYFVLLMLIAYLTGRKSDSNAAFFLGNRRSPWYIVAFGMIGTSISGVTFVSVPGMVRGIGFAYMQTVLGFFVGYILIATVLLPIYYKLNLTTIYGYLRKRLGERSYRTGAWFFLLSRTIGAAARLFVVAALLQTFVFDEWGVPFVITVTAIVFLIWLYTFRSGIKTIIWTDTIQTFFLIAALVLIIIKAQAMLKTGFSETFSLLVNSDLTRVFVFDDWVSQQNFFKQFFSGIFITIVMTGLDQDMMQKNLSCRNLREAQKNMYSYGFSFIPVNLLFLSLGALLMLIAQQNGITLPEKPDEILPMFANGLMGEWVTLFFFIGIVAASFASSDSALTALTTSFAVDILDVEKHSEQRAKRTRMWVHLGISVLFAIIIVLIEALSRNNSIIDTIYRIAAYTYGPLLGLFAFGLFTRRTVYDRLVPCVAVASPVLIAVLDYFSKKYWEYSFGYELLMINGAITFLGLWCLSKKKND
ncbi:MAG: sodium:solute symporter [Prevotellaceae bacterium]|jgi:SSS family transporter|nr:sodium:solute symporter [Prevotellaceae bacterium]